MVAELHRNERDVARWITTAGRTAEISATRRAAIAAGFQKLPTFLDELRKTYAMRPLFTYWEESKAPLYLFGERLEPFFEVSARS